MVISHRLVLKIRRRLGDYSPVLRTAARPVSCPFRHGHGSFWFHSQTVPRKVVGHSSVSAATLDSRDDDRQPPACSCWPAPSRRPARFIRNLLLQATIR